MSLSKCTSLPQYNTLRTMLPLIGATLYNVAPFIGPYRYMKSYNLSVTMWPYRGPHIVQHDPFMGPYRYKKYYITLGLQDWFSYGAIF